MAPRRCHQRTLPPRMLGKRKDHLHFRTHPGNRTVEAINGTEADFRRLLRALKCGRHHGRGYPRQMVVGASVEQRRPTRRTMTTTCSPAKVLTAVTAMMLVGSLAGGDAAANAFKITER